MIGDSGVAGPMDERRKKHRSRTIKVGKIIFNRKLSVIDCAIRNLTDRGANLVLPNITSLPETFELHIPIDALKRSCRVVWRLPDRIGVAFD